MFARAGELEAHGRSLNRLYDGADDAWRATLRHLAERGDDTDEIQDPLSIGSLFGDRPQRTRELLATQFGIANSRRRIVRSARRRFNISHAVAQLFWILAGSDDAGLIGFYHPFGRKLSDDGMTLFAAPGARIFSSSNGDQFESVVRRLTSDRATRRAVIQILVPADAIEERKDISCFLAAQFFIRHDKLSCIGLMRSQSAAMVLPHDLFLLLMLHEAVAARLGISTGPYYHWAGSLHYYATEEVMVRGIMAERVQPPIEMPPMPPLTLATRRNLAAVEVEVRSLLSANIDASIDLARYDLDPYWTDLFSVLVAGARHEHGARSIGQDRIPEWLRPISRD